MENTNKAYMALLEYNVDNNLVGENDKDMLTEFMDYNGSTCICEAMSEIADSNVSVYNSDICENTWNLYSSGSYEDASNEGLMGDSNDLIKNLMCAWYYYNEEQLNHNLDTMIYNYAINYINENSIVLSITEWDSIEGELYTIDSNSTFDMITEAVDNVVNMRGDL
jgi:hypothetical protein